MSLLPRFLSENLFNNIAFPDHTLSANEEAAGNEVWRISTGRRANARNKWTPTTLNQDAWAEVLSNRQRSADMIVLDRGHNLSGFTIRLEVSDNDFGSTMQVFSLTVPTITYPNANLEDTPGVRTEEGVWMFRFPVTTASYWRLFVPAMGAGLKPEVVGLYVGLSYQPDYHMELPYEDESGETFYQEVRSDTAWVASTRAAHRRAGNIGLKLSSPGEYDRARYHLKRLFMAERRLMWIVFNQEEAERAVLAKHASGSYGFNREDGWSNRQARFPWFEHEPKLT